MTTTPDPKVASKADTDTITIRTDQGELVLPRGCTLADALESVLARQGKSADSVATAVNGHFVPRGARAEHVLEDGDALLCFAPITGG